MNWFKSFWKKPAASAAKVTPASTEPKPTFFTWAKPYLSSAQKHNLAPLAVEALTLSREEARQLNHNYVGTEHLLLGIIKLGDGVSSTLLKAHGLAPETSHEEIIKLLPVVSGMKPTGPIPYTPRVKKVLALAMQETRALGHPRIGPEHILLGLLLEGGGMAARVLQKRNLDLQTTRNEILKHFGQAPSPASGAPKPAQPVTHNFTPRALEVLVWARKECERFNHNFIGTEHLLLGITKLGDDVSITVLKNQGLALETARQEIEKHLGRGPDVNLTGRVPYTPRVKKVLALSMREAQALNHPQIGPEHILLGLLREGDGLAARILQNYEIDLETTRNEILKNLSQTLPAAPDALKPPEPPPEKPPESPPA